MMLSFYLCQQVRRRGDNPNPVYAPVLAAPAFPAFFFRRSLRLMTEKGHSGILATNSIADGDTNRIALGLIDLGEGEITRAQLDIPWPGTAGVVVTAVHLVKGRWAGAAYLNDRRVMTISSGLTEGDVKNIHELSENQGKAFVGSYPLGEGFIVSAETAEKWIELDEKNAEVLRPYIIGKELYSLPDPRPQRWIVCFWDWSEEKAQDFPEIYSHIRRYVQPVRAKVNRPRRRKIWWQYAESQSGLYEALGQGSFLRRPRHKSRIEPIHTALVKAKTSNTWAFTFVSAGIIFDQSLAIFTFATFDIFAFLQSFVHEVWAQERGSTLKTDMSYTPSTVFTTLPFPEKLESLASIGASYYESRRQLMLGRNEGLTKIYNRFHDRNDLSTDIKDLRNLHRDLDQAVVSAYGWADIDLGHDFRDANHSTRFTLSGPARKVLLERLLNLNQERYEEDFQRGLDSQTGVRVPPNSTIQKKVTADNSGQENLFMGESSE